MLRIATIGTSWITTQFADAASRVPGVELAVAYSRDADRARAFAAEIGAAGSTADLDGDIHRLRGLDGAVLDGPVDSPHGRVATVADPQGASFQLLQPPSA